MKILNLYACLGGNRYKWNEVAKEAGIKIEVTAIENDEVLAKLYKERFKNDFVIVADAHEYLLNNFSEFDFIWSSPPCPSHSRIRISQKNRKTFKPVYPDMKLYEEILFLDNYFNGKYCVENVMPYYEPLISAQKIGRHLFWANFELNNCEGRKRNNIIEIGNIKELSEFHEYDFKKYKGKQRLNKIARNLVDYEIGKAIFEKVLGIISKNKTMQYKLFMK